MGRTLSPRVWGALALSIVAHVAAMFGLPQFELGWIEPPPPRPIDARIVQASPPAVLPAIPPAPAAVPAPEPALAPVARPEAPKVATSKPRPPARPKPVAKPVPSPPVALPDPVPAEPAVSAAEAAAGGEPAPDAPSETAEAGTGAPSAVVADAGVPSGGAPSAAEPQTVPVAAEPAVPESRPAVNYPLKSARVVYDLSYGENPMRVGRVTHLWTNDGDRYFAETIVEATGLFALFYGGQYVQRSWGGFGAQGLVPSEYFVQRGRPDRGETAVFDWEAHNVAFSWRSERRSAKLVVGTQDPISLLHQIFYMQPLPESKLLSVATSRKFGEFLFQFIGEERIDTPMGELTALHVRRKDEDADHVDVWVDPQRGWLPVRVHYVDRRGYVFDQRVREMSFEPMAPLPHAAAR